jgi:hypothetical protein
MTTSRRGREPAQAHTADALAREAVRDARQRQEGARHRARQGAGDRKERRQPVPAALERQHRGQADRYAQPERQAAAEQDGRAP